MKLSKKINFIILLISILIFFGFNGCFIYDKYERNQILPYLEDRILGIVIPAKLDVKEIDQSNFDVYEMNLSLNLDPRVRFIKGSAQISFILKSGNAIELNCSDELIIDKILFNKKNSKFNHNKNIIRIELGSDYISDTVELIIDYHGVPKKIKYKGILFGIGKSGNYCYTLNEANFAQTWFPCKDDPFDKFLLKTKIETPKTYYAISNGKLDSTIISYENCNYYYSSSYPISTYLAAFAIGNYENIRDTIKSISGKEIILDYYVFPDEVEKAKVDFAEHKKYFNFLENLLGEYPFIEDKYGVVSTYDNLGGMENQTITFIESKTITGHKLYSGLLVHELIHSWFGNSATLKSWKDVWLNESFAEFFEYLYQEKIENKKMFARLTRKNFYGSIYDPNSYLFGGSVYKKGAAVIYMLKNEIGDSLFYKIIKEYLSDYKYKNVSTDEFIIYFEKNANKNLEQFFKQWIYSKCNKPYFNIKYNIMLENGLTNINITIEQTQPCHLYELKFPVKLYSSKDTLIYLPISKYERVKQYEYKINHRVDSIAFDPENEILCNISENK